MRTVNIDGLPGLTMQGIKGSLGERGGSMFYNFGSRFAFSSDFIKAMAVSENDIDIEEFSTSNIKCIPCNGVKPILNDYFFNIENNYTSLYVIKDIIYFSITSYDVDGVTYYDETETGDISTYSNLLEDKAPLISIIGGYLKLYNSSKNLQSITQNDEDMFKKYPVYVLKYLDTWEYLDNNPSSVDISISALVTPAHLNVWNGKYEVKKQKCSGHKFDIVNVAVDGDYLASVYSQHADDVQEEGFSFKILDASTYLPIEGLRAGNIKVFKNSDLLDWQNGIQSFEQNGANIVFQTENGYTENGAVHEIPLSDGPYNTLYMLIEIEGYFATRVFLTGATDYTVYMFQNILSDEVLNADFEVVHEYEYFDTSSPENKNTIEDVVITKFYVNSPLPKEEKAKFRIEAEFTSGFSKKYMMSTMRNNLWVSSEEPTTVEDKIIAEKYGKAENFDYTMNFDNEDPGDFMIVIKDYGEGNDSNLYISSVIVPHTFVTNYTMNVYAYYRAAADNCIKLFLGKGTLGDSIS